MPSPSRPWKSILRANFALCIFSIGKQGSEQSKTLRSPFVLSCKLTGHLRTYIEAWTTGKTYKTRTVGGKEKLIKDGKRNHHLNTKERVVACTQL